MFKEISFLSEKYLPLEAFIIFKKSPKYHSKKILLADLVSDTHT